MKKAKFSWHATETMFAIPVVTATSIVADAPSVVSVLLPSSFAPVPHLPVYVSWLPPTQDAVVLTQIAENLLRTLENWSEKLR